MSSWVTTVFISFGKALLISLGILIGSCCIRFLYRLWIRKMGCYEGSEDLSDSYKYEMELQTDADMNHTSPSHRPSAQDAISEIELPPSPGANTSCPPYNTNSIQPDKASCDDFSDNFSGMWRQDPTSEAGEMTDCEGTSVAAETTTMCSVLTGTEETSTGHHPHYPTDSPILPKRRSFSSSTSSLAARLQTPPSPSRHRQQRSPPISEMQAAPLPDLPKSPTVTPTSMPTPMPIPMAVPTLNSEATEFQEYQCYVDPSPGVGPPSRRNTPTRQQQHDRGTELFLSQYYKSLEQEGNGGGGSCGSGSSGSSSSSGTPPPPPPPPPPSQ